MDLDDGKYADRRKIPATKRLELAEQQKQPPLEAFALLAALDLMRGDAEGGKVDEALARLQPPLGRRRTKRWPITKSCVACTRRRTTGCRNPSRLSPTAGPRKPSSA